MDDDYKYKYFSKEEAFSDLISRFESNNKLKDNMERYLLVLEALKNNNYTYDELKQILADKAPPSFPGFMNRLKGQIQRTGFSVERLAGGKYELIFKEDSRALVFFEAPATHTKRVLVELQKRNEAYLKEGKDIRVLEAGPVGGQYDIYAVFRAPTLEVIYEEVFIIQSNVSDDPVLVQRLDTHTYPIIKKGSWVIEECT